MPSRSATRAGLAHSYKRPANFNSFYLTRRCVSVSLNFSLIDMESEVAQVLLPVRVLRSPLGRVVCASNLQNRTAKSGCATKCFPSPVPIASNKSNANSSYFEVARIETSAALAFLSLVLPERSFPV